MDAFIVDDMVNVGFENSQPRGEALPPADLFANEDATSPVKHTLEPKLTLADLFANEDATSPIRHSLGPKEFFGLRSVGLLSIPPPQMPCKALYLQLLNWTSPTRSHPWTFGITLPMVSQTPFVAPRRAMPMASSHHYPASPPTPETCRDPWRVPMSAKVLSMALSDLVFVAAKAMFSSSTELSSSVYDIDLIWGNRSNSPISNRDVFLLNPIKGHTNVVTSTHPISQALADQGVRSMHLHFCMPKFENQFRRKMWMSIDYLLSTVPEKWAEVKLDFIEKEDGSIEQTATDYLNKTVPEETIAKATSWLTEALTSPLECTWVLSMSFYLKTLVESQLDHELNKKRENALIMYGQRNKTRVQHTCYRGYEDRHTGYGRSSTGSSTFSTSVNIWVDERLDKARFKIPL